MASEKVSAFNLYLLDVFDLVKTPNMSSEEAYNIIEEEWKGLSRDIVFYYISKERELEIKNHMNHISQMSYNNDNNDNSIYSQRNIRSIHELNRLMYLQNMHNYNNHNNHNFSRVEFAKSA